jgi:hypothetical protein
LSPAPPISDKTRWSTALGRLESSILNLDTELAAVQADLEATGLQLPDPGPRCFHDRSARLLRMVTA